MRQLEPCYIRPTVFGEFVFNLSRWKHQRTQYFLFSLERDRFYGKNLLSLNVNAKCSKLGGRESREESVEESEFKPKAMAMDSVDAGNVSTQTQRQRHIANINVFAERVLQTYVPKLESCSPTYLPYNTRQYVLV